MGIFEELQERGLIAQVTDNEEIRDLINSGGARFYIGFDPTADSLHVGHFMALCLMKRLQMAGNKPIVLIGGGTGHIGDPSGRTDMRSMMTSETIQHNCDCFKKQMERFKITGKDIKAALKTSSPIIVTFIVLGIGYGILMQEHGYGPVWSLLSGILIFSGTAQFVSITMLSTGSFIMAAITALMVSARHIFFSISMIGRYRNEGKKKWYLYYALCDETYAMLSSKDAPEGVNTGGYRLLVTLLDQCSWIAGSVLGGWLGTVLVFDSTGIDFAMTALFTTVFIQQWIDSKCHIPAVLGVAATLGCRLVFGPDIFLIPAMIIIVAVLSIMRKKIEAEMASQSEGAEAGKKTIQTELDELKKANNINRREQ